MLILKKNKFFIIGGVFFAFAHILLIFCFYSQEIKVIHILLLIIIYLVATWLLAQRLKKDMSPRMLLALYVYMVINSVMNCYAWLRYFTFISETSL